MGSGYVAEELVAAGLFTWGRPCLQSPCSRLGETVRVADMGDGGIVVAKQTAILVEPVFSAGLCQSSAHLMHQSVFSHGCNIGLATLMGGLVRRAPSSNGVAEVGALVVDLSVIAHDSSWKEARGQ